MLTVQELLAPKSEGKLAIHYYECTVRENYRFRVEGEPATIGCDICLNGAYECWLAGQRHCRRNAGDAGVWGGPATVEAQLRPGRYCWLSVSIARKHVEELLGDCEVLLKQNESHILRDVGDAFSRSSKGVANLRFIAEKILHCPFEGNLANSYMHCKGMEFLLECLNSQFTLCKGQPQTAAKAKIDEAWQLLLSRLDAPPTISSIAQRVGISESSLKRSFREIYGTSIFSLFQQYRMTEAKKLLENGYHNVTEVAFKLGYSNSGHFSRAFCKHFGISPKTCLRGMPAVN